MATTTSSALPSLAELQRFVADGECHDVAPWVAKALPRYRLRVASGAYLASRGRRYRDHSWVVAPDGTVIDTTHGQFDRLRPVLIAAPGTPEHSRYLSTDHMTKMQLIRTFGDEGGCKPGEPDYTGRL